MNDCITFCLQVFQPVEELPKVENATRNHAYVLPNNIVHILNYDGTGYIKLN